MSEPETNSTAIAGSSPVPCSRLRELTELIRESKKGKWRVILDYDNYQDGARILDGDGKLLGGCYELPPEDMDVDDGIAWQFSKALDQAQSSENVRPLATADNQTPNSNGQS